MTKPLFRVSVSSVKVVHDMPGTWSDDGYRKLLAQLEVDNVDGASSGDLLELVLMALQDMEPDDAADAVLAYKLQGDISAGARRNIVQDMLEGQKPWEEVADITLHSRIFSAAVLLHKTFPASYTQPDMMQVLLDITALVPEAKEVLSRPPTASFIARLLADAMDTHSILERLFDEQLVSQSFPEARSIVWLAEFGEQLAADNTSVTLTIYSSVHWLDAMETISAFESSAYDDNNSAEADPG